MRSIHCLSGRWNTGWLPRSLRPSAVTSSLASTVPSAGHQFTGASSRYARRYESTTARRASASSSAHGRSSGLASLTGVAGAGLELGDQLGDRAGAVGVVVVPGVEDLQEDPLRPAVVVDVGGGDAAARVVPEPERPELPAHVGDVRLGGDTRVLAGLHRVLLGGEPERVVAHRVQHVVAAHAHEAREHVGADVAERVPDVEPGAARVREHVEHVELAAAGDGGEAVGELTGRVRRPERVARLPAVLPLRLDLVGEARRCSGTRRVGSGGAAGSSCVAASVPGREVATPAGIVFAPSGL